MPSMLRTNSYDTICHEHLEFYSLRVVKNLLEGEGLRIIDVQMNDINGGSFAITVAKKNSKYEENLKIIEIHSFNLVCLCLQGLKKLFA